MSKGTYGAKQGIPRILNMLDVQGIEPHSLCPPIMPPYTRRSFGRSTAGAMKSLTTVCIILTAWATTLNSFLRRPSALLWELCGVKPTGFRPTEEEFTGVLGAAYAGARLLLHLLPGQLGWASPGGNRGKSVPWVDLMADAFYDDTAYDYYIDSPLPDMVSICRTANGDLARGIRRHGRGRGAVLWISSSILSLLAVPAA